MRGREKAGEAECPARVEWGNVEGERGRRGGGKEVVPHPAGRGRVETRIRPQGAVSSRLSDRRLLPTALHSRAQLGAGSRSAPLALT